MTQTLRVGTRGSALALAQTRQIIDMLHAWERELAFEIVEITTHGDRFEQTPIAAMATRLERGIFNAGLEEALLKGEVDLVTCSLKDVESARPPGIAAVSVGRREDVRDVLITRHKTSLRALPPGAVLATSSPRRSSQLKAFRPDFRFASLRGNITTRLEGAVPHYDGVVLAGAGLLRLGLEGRVCEWIGEEVLLPAAAQAALGCQYLAEREDIGVLLSAIRDTRTECCVMAEKKLLVALSGGCFAPVGVLARMRKGVLQLRCRIVSSDGQNRLEDLLEGSAEQTDELVDALARRLIAAGARKIIEQARTGNATGASSAPAL